MTAFRSVKFDVFPRFRTSPLAEELVALRLGCAERSRDACARGMCIWGCMCMCMCVEMRVEMRVKMHVARYHAALHATARCCLPVCSGR